jgi:hypothetical protein
MGLTQETNHRAAVLELAAPFWGKPRIVSILVAVLDQIQRIEDDAWDILTLRTIDNADLVRLKVLGKLVGQPRFGFGLEDYRDLVRARARANRSQGRALDLVEVMAILVGEANFSMTEGGNATLYISALTPLTDTDVAKIGLILPDTRAAGVGVQFLWSDEAVAAAVFVWGDPWSTAETWASVRVM